MYPERLPIFTRAALLLLLVLPCAVFGSPTDSGVVRDQVLRKMESEGQVRVMVRLRDAEEGPHLRRSARGDRARHGWKERRARLLGRLPDRVRARLKSYRRLPYLALDMDHQTFNELQSSGDVEAIFEDKLHTISLSSSGPLIGTDVAHAAGYTGAGSYVAILDSGIDIDHEFFAGKTVVEACFSTNYAPHRATTTCPNSGLEQFGPGAARPCTLGSCDHGTHVAGIAAGDGRGIGMASGVAPDAGLIAIQIFSYLNGSSIGAYTSDIVAAMEYVLELKEQHGYNIAAVNLSIGGDPEATPLDCDSYNGHISADKYAIDLLRGAGIATVVAAGNNGSATGISSPGCISSAVSVGATTDADNITSYSNRASWLSLLAPGTGIYSARVAPSVYGSKSGTSMATPQVTGAFAVVKAAAEAAGLVGATQIDRLLATLTASAADIIDPATGIWFPRLQLDGALSTVQSGSLAIDQILDSGYDGSVVAGGFDTLTDTSGFRGQYHLSRDPVGSNRFRFPISVSEAGQYLVSAWWPADSGGNASYTLNTGAGVYNGVVDQGAGGDNWQGLGRFPFSSSGTAYMEFRDDRGEQVVVDAIRIESDPGVAIATSSLPDGRVGEAYRVQLEAAGGIPPYSWATEGGALPPGIDLTSDGLLDGVPSEHGSYSFAVSVMDQAGATGQVDLVITVDPAPNTAPTLAINRPANGSSFFVGDGVRLEGVANDSEDGDLSDQINWSSDRDGYLATGAGITLYSLTPGAHLLSAIVADQGGLSASASRQISVLPVNSPPIVQLTNPTAGASVTLGESVLFAATASDPDGSVAAVEFLVDGSSVGVRSAIPYTLNWTPAASGSYTITAVATDNNGASSISQGVGLTVNEGSASGGAEVTVSLRNGVAGYTGTSDVFLYSSTNYGNDPLMIVYGGHIVQLLRFAVFQSEGGPVPDGAVVTAAALKLYKTSSYAGDVAMQRLLVDWAEDRAAKYYRMTGVGWSEPAASGLGSDIMAEPDAEGVLGGGTGWVSFDMTAPLQAMSGTGSNHGWRIRSNGSNSALYFHSSDYSGNLQLRPELTISYLAPAVSTNAAPTVNLTGPVQGLVAPVGESLNISAVAGDSDGSVASVEFLVDGVQVGIDTSSPYTIAWIPTVSGSHTITAVATDNVGASSVSAAVDVIVNAPPVAELVSPQDASSLPFGGAVTLSAAASDPDGEVVVVEFFVDGASVGTRTQAPYAVDWTPPSTGSYQIMVAVTDDAGITTMSMAAGVTIVDQIPVTVSLQEGVAGYAGTSDVFLYSSTNYGNDPLMIVFGGHIVQLLRFAVFQSEGGPIPDGAVVTAAALKLYKSSSYAGDFAMQRLLVAWAEDRAAKYYRMTGVGWSEPAASGLGSDIMAAPDAEGVLGGGTGWVSFDMTAPLQAMSGTGSNHGWRIRANGSNSALYFHSSDYSGNLQLRPELTISYLAPAVSTSAAPTMNLTAPGQGLVAPAGE